jgi:hypothetical protein
MQCQLGKCRERDDPRLTREGAGQRTGRQKPDSGRRRDGRTQGQLGKTQVVEGHRANSGRRREWEDTKPSLEGAEGGRKQGQLGKAQEMGGYVQGLLWKDQGVGGHKANSGRRRE